MFDFSIEDIDRLTPFISVFDNYLASSLEEETKDAYDQMIKNWEAGQDAMGNQWAPLAPSTIESKGGDQILIETRQMIESANYEVNKDDLNARISIEDEQGKVLAHEYGVPDQGLPPRPILGPTAKYMGKESDAIIKKAFAKSWATAQVSGTAVNLGIGGGKLGGGK